MDVRVVDLPETTIIGKSGLCTKEKNISGELWQQANEHFHEIAGLGLKDAKGRYTGFWGAMSDESMQFLPWADDFSRGLYLAGIEAAADAEAPEGWTKWTLPARKYLVAEVQQEKYYEIFLDVIYHVIPDRGFRLAGAACDHTDPGTGNSQLYFPVEELK